MREKEFKQIKEIIKEWFEYGDCGLYNCRNLMADCMATLFEGEYFTLEICYNWSYFEVFGTTDEEFTELLKYYDNLKKS